jgi:hypothetical protein
VLGVGVQLDRDGLLRREAVAVHHRGPRVVEHARHVALEDRLLFLQVADLEALAVDGRVVLGDRLFVEVQRVVRADVVAVLHARFAQRIEAAVLVAEADLVQAERGERLHVARIDPRRLGHHLDDVVVAMLPLGVLGDDLEERRVLGVQVEHLLLHGLEARDVVREEAAGGLHRQELEVRRIDLEAAREGRVGGGDVHRAQREAGADEVGRAEVRVHLEGLVDLALGRLEIHGVLELHAGHGDADAGVLGRERERLLDDLAGVARVVLLEEEIGAPEERLDPLLGAGLLGGVVRLVRVLGRAEQVRGAADEAHALGVAVDDDVAVVVLDHAAKGLARLAALAGADEQLAEHDARSVRAVLGLDVAQDVDRLLDLALRSERLGLHGDGEELRLLAEGRRASGGGDGVAVAAGEHLQAGLADLRLAALWAALDRVELLLGARVVALLDEQRSVVQGLARGLVGERDPCGGEQGSGEEDGEGRAVSHGR